MRQVITRSGALLGVLGQGTWEMGARRTERAREVAALRLGFDLGLTLVDTAEMYADGGAEEVVAEAMQGRRDEVFVVTKVLPRNASRRGTLSAAERSLQRLRTDHIDLYLLHWDGPHPIAETLAAFAELRRQGKVLHYGVSNFDLKDMLEVERTPDGAAVCADQVFYNLMRRGIERNLLPWCIERKIAIMAYTPVEQGRLAKPGRSGQRRALEQVAKRHGATLSQVALAWTIRTPGVVAVVKAAHPEHVRENAGAVELQLDVGDLRELDAAFPVPDRDIPLETL
jgi:aryl-alcohol dehydrogenase-like predicted oxidoreductase